MDPSCSRSERTSSLIVHMTTIISTLINLTHMQLFYLLHPNLCLSLFCNTCLLTTTCSTTWSFPPPQARFRREPTPRYGQRTRYDNGFHGYWFSCNGYGHRVVDCRRYARRYVGRPNTQIKCWTCGLLGHVASACCTMRCYSCNGFGHRARDCWYSRRQPMRNGLTRRIDEPWRKGPSSGTGSGQKASVVEQGKAQVWMNLSSKSTLIIIK